MAANLNIPKGGVVAFEHEICPKGWSEYKAVYGKFIRGLDKSGLKIDPDGQRLVGKPQDDDFKEHYHLLPREVWSFSGTGSNNKPANAKGGAGVTQTMIKGGKETRPKNVALLYCQKQ